MSWTLFRMAKMFGNTTTQYHTSRVSLSALNNCLFDIWSTSHILQTSLSFVAAKGTRVYLRLVYCRYYLFYYLSNVLINMLSLLPWHLPVIMGGTERDGRTGGGWGEAAIYTEYSQSNSTAIIRIIIIHDSMFCQWMIVSNEAVSFAAASTAVSGWIVSLM